MKVFLIWILIILLGAATGILLVEFLVTQPKWILLFGISGLVCLIGGIAISILALPKNQVVWGVLTLMIFLAAGYVFRTQLFLNQAEQRDLPEITRQAGDGHIAVLYFTHGEPETYNPMPWIETMQEFDADGAEFIPKLFRPFFFFNFRSEYLRLGASPHNQIHLQIAHQVEWIVTQHYHTTDIRFYTAFLDSDPRPDEVLIQAINAGADRVIVVPVFITESSHTLAGEAYIQSIPTDQYGVQISFVEPFWASTSLQQSFVKRANENMQSNDKSKVGILLVGHGQPETWDSIYPTQTEQENSFRESIRELLIQDGYAAENILLTWMEFKTPNIETGLHQLAENGVEEILVFSTSISAASLHSDIEVPDAIEKAKLPPSITVKDLGAWGDPSNPMVIKAIYEQIQPLLP